MAENEQTATATDAKFEAWHFLPHDRRIVNHHGCAVHGGVLITPGQKLTVPGPVEPCRYGLHASRSALDAVGFASSSIIQRVLISGEVVEQTDKVVATERTCLWVMDASIALHVAAVNFAQVALDARLAKGEGIDPRSQAALDVKLRWLKREASDSDLAAARDAAWYAARYAAWDAAWYAARDAAWYAARYAAWDAARYAARAAAWAAARDAAWDLQNTILETALFTQYETGHGVFTA